MQISVGNGTKFGIVSILVSVCSLSGIVQSHLSWLWLHAGKQSMWRAKEVEHID